jgi:CBS-domain-containing membrane protein
MPNILASSLPRPSVKSVLLSGFGGFLAIAALALLSDISELGILIAPFGATCVLLFAAQSSPLSQPRNVIGGHFCATLLALCFHSVLPLTWWAMALTVGCAIALMVALRVTHPPAGADPLAVFASDPTFGFLLVPVLAGSVILVALAIIYHRINGVEYPHRVK